MSNVVFSIIALSTVLLTAFAYKVFSLTNSEVDKRLALAFVAIILGCTLGKFATVMPP